MQTKKLADYWQVIGNVGLVLGLVLVGFQIQQNTEIAKMQMVHQDMLAVEARSLAMFGENPAQAWAKSISDPSSLSLEEHVVLDNVIKAHLNHIEKLVRLEELGFELIDPMESQMIGGLAYYLSSEYGRSWWAENRDIVNRPDIREAISAALNRFPNNYLMQEIVDLNSEVTNHLNQTDP